MASEQYKRLLEQAWDVHVRKNAGYAGENNPDPWANFRMCEEFGITAFEGCMVRLSDKYIRVTNLMKSPHNEQVGESLRDTLMDLAAYAHIAICLLDEEEAKIDASIYGPEPTEEEWRAAVDKALDQAQREAVEPPVATCKHGVVKREGVACLVCTLASWNGNNH